MNKVRDWILSQMRLVDMKDDQEDSEQDAVPIEKSWLELVHRKTIYVLLWSQDSATRLHMSDYNRSNILSMLAKKRNSTSLCRKMSNHGGTGQICLHLIAPQRSN